MANLIFRGFDEILRIKKQKYITNKLKAHIVKEPTLYQWLQIKTIDYENFTPERILKEIISIMIPEINVEELVEIDLLKIGNECIDIFNNGLVEPTENAKEKIGLHKMVENNNQDKVYINISYLILKCCKFTNMSFKEVLNLNVFTFFNIISTIKAIEGEELLNLATICDNHLNLKNKNTASKYKDTLEKYKEDFKMNGIKIVRGFNPDRTNELKQLLKGGLK